MPTPPVPAPPAAVPPTPEASPAQPRREGSGGSVRCRHAAPGALKLRCTRCRSERCSSCCERRTIRLEPTWLCPCSGFCMPLPSADARATAGPAEDLAASLADPVRPGTRVRFGMAAGMLGAAAVLASIPLLDAFGLVLSVLARLYVVAWLLKIVRETVAKPERATEWPDLVDPLPDLFWPFLRTLVAAAIAGGPAAAAAHFYGAGALATWALLMAGCVVFPPVMAALGVLESFSALSPLLFARMLRRSPAHWVIASAFLAAAVIVSVADDALFSLVPYAGAFADAAVALYLAIAFARFLGRVVASLDSD